MSRLTQFLVKVAWVLPRYFMVYVRYILYVQCFMSFYAEEEADVETLLNLSERMIEQLLPTMKLRVKLLKLIEQLKGNVTER